MTNDKDLFSLVCRSLSLVRAFDPFVKRRFFSSSSLDSFDYCLPHFHSISAAQNYKMMRKMSTIDVFF